MTDPVTEAINQQLQKLETAIDKLQATMDKIDRDIRYLYGYMEQVEWIAEEARSYATAPKFDDRD